MKEDNYLHDWGELKLIKLIEDLILEKTGKKLIRDDSFFYKLKYKKIWKNSNQLDLILNSDMFVFSTDAPPFMSFNQIGRKSVLMNISDLVVKGVKPVGLILSLGLPASMKLENFIELMKGVINYSLIWNLEYIGGDLNETKELIINPTVFGFQHHSKIIYRNGMNKGDFLITNGKFGLTSVGFDILLKRRGNPIDYPNFNRALKAVLEPEEIGLEALILAENRLATASIDSSDGLIKSLTDLMISNPNLGFEIDFNDMLIDNEAIKYCEKFSINPEDLILNGGEEFIHLFTINPKDFNIAKKEIQAKNGQIFKVGKVIDSENIYIIKKNEKIGLNYHGFEHFKNKIKN